MYEEKAAIGWNKDEKYNRRVKTFELRDILMDFDVEKEPIFDGLK